MPNSNVITGMTILGLLMVGGLSWSQAQILERMSEKVKEKVDRKIDEKIDEALDDSSEAKKADSPATAPKGKVSTTNPGSTAQDGHSTQVVLLFSVVLVY